MAHATRPLWSWSWSWTWTWTWTWSGRRGETRRPPDTDTPHLLLPVHPASLPDTTPYLLHHTTIPPFYPGTISPYSLQTSRPHLHYSGYFTMLFSLGIDAVGLAYMVTFAFGLQVDERGDTGTRANDFTAKQTKQICSCNGMELLRAT
ncbi:hypothetical protein RRF57_005058 [Xylaria bambusicola]|uniref:Uncharacterized protein n=1 Tax=Xylaria bambusicola TaxID=326684 RepID=A0AAN7ULA1_9PEZI